MIVEFVGLPGSGKTTVSQLSASLLMEAGYLFQTGTLNRYDGNVRAQQAASIALQPKLAWLLRSCPRELALRMLRRSWLMRGLQPRTLLDSGPIFTASGLVAYTDPSPLLDLIPLPDAIVQLELDPVTAAARVRARGASHASLGRPEVEAIAYVARRAEGIELLVPFAVRPTLKVDASSPPLSVAKQAAEWLASMSEAQQV